MSIIKVEIKEKREKRDTNINSLVNLKGVFAKNERGYRHNAKKKRF